MKEDNSVIKIGDKWRGKIIRDVIKLSNGWFILKTDNKKSLRDFKVRTILSFQPKHSFTPKHAHFVIDFYGKLCQNRVKTLKLFEAIIEVWHNKDIKEVLNNYSTQVQDLPGYTLEYILHALKWILEQEDINFRGRPEKLQKELNEICKSQNVVVPKDRYGSQLAISIFCNLIKGVHPVEALLKANLDILPRIRK